MTDPRSALVALSEKYAVLARLRDEPLATEAGDYAARRRAEKRAIAARFPGALRELDALPCRELQARGRASEEAGFLVEAGGGGWEALPQRLVWLRWIWDFHQTARALLREKRSRPANEVARGACPPERLGGEPPRLRMVEEIFTTLGACYGVSAQTVRDTLFTPVPTAS